MKLIYSLVSLFLFITSLNAKPLQPAPDTWKLYNIIDGVSCEMPGEPERDTTYKREASILLKNYVLEYVSDDNEDKNILYSINYTDCPVPRDSLFDSLWIHNSYDKIKKTSIAQGLDIFGFEISKVDDYFIATGKVIVPETEDVLVFRYLFFEKGLIISMVRVDYKYYNNPWLKRFFNSIQFNGGDIKKSVDEISNTLEWKPLTGPYGAFKAIFPGQAYIDSSALTVNNSYIRIINHSYVSESLNDPNQVYEIRYIVEKISADSLASEAYRNHAYEIILNTSNVKNNIELQYKREVELNGILAREVSILNRSEQIIVKSRCYLTPEGVVYAMVRTTSANDSNACMMKFFNSIELLNNAAVSSPPSAIAQSSWETVYSSKMAFSIDFPCMPAYDSTVTPILSLDLIKYFYSCEPDYDSDSNIIYKCLVQIIPNEMSILDSNLSTFGYVKNTILGVKENPNIEIIRESPIELLYRGNTFNGTELVLFNKSGNTTIRNRFYSLKDKVIQLTVVAPAGVQENENMMKFFNSLKILNQ